MPDFILINEDQVIFLPIFGPAIVTVRPGQLEASGPATCNGIKVCLEGDEKKVEVPGCPYISPPHVVPGVGTLKILELAPNQIAMKTFSGKKPVLLKGMMFMAIFQVQAPATTPPPPATPDPVPEYPGQGMFVNANFKFRGT